MHRRLETICVRSHQTNKKTPIHLPSPTQKNQRCDMSEEWLLVVNQILAGIILIQCTFFIWCLIILHNHKDEIYIVKRRIFFVLLQLLLMIFIAITDAIWLAVVRGGLLSHPSSLYLFIFNILSYFAGQLIWMIILERYWLLYFDISLSRLIANQSWQMAINPRATSKNWFLNLTNQKLFGNDGKYLIMAAIFWCCIETTILMLIAEKSGIYAADVGNCLTFIKGIAMCVIWYKLKDISLYDVFGIRQEMTKIIKICILWNVFAAIIFFTYIYVRYDPKLSNIVDIIILIYNCGYATFHPAIFYITVPNVIKTQSRINSRINTGNYSIIRAVSKSDRSSKTKSKNITTNNFNINIKQRKDTTTQSSNSYMKSGSVSPHSPPVNAAHGVGVAGPDEAMSNLNIGLSTTMMAQHLVNDEDVVEMVDMIDKATHWREIVTTRDGYQLFMNHLQSEFSGENLLFITEYVQVKYVLSIKFKSIFEELLINNNKTMAFNIILPDIEQMFGVNNNNNNNDTSNTGNMLDLPIGNGTADDDDNDIIGDSRCPIPMSLIASKLLNDGIIISAFKAIYNKYIDSDYAPFLVNVSHRKREKLMKLLDSNYFAIMNDNGNNSGEEQGSDSKLKRLSVSISRVLSPRSRNNGFKTYNMDQCMVEIEWENHDKSIKWLLKTLITQMDGAAAELAKSMRDSFIRFQYLFNK